MIVVRITNVQGSCAVAGYDSYFPAEALLLGFGGSTKSSERKQPIASLSAAAGRSNASPSVIGAEVAPPSHFRDSEAGFTELSIHKQVDTATCDLMLWAMKHRSKTRASDSPLTADVAFLHVTGDSTKASLQIKVGNVLVKNWGLESYEDGRPKESLSLWFDQVALKYLPTKDGKVVGPAIEKGWDQKKNTDWKVSFPK